MDKSRSYSQRDTTAGSSRDTSNRSSRPLDLSRPSNTRYDRAYSTRDAAGQGGSGSGDYRAYSTHDAAVGSASGYDRAYSTYDVSQHYSSQLGFSTMQPGETSHWTTSRVLSTLRVSSDGTMQPLDTPTQTSQKRDRGPLGEIFETSSQGHTQESLFESPTSQNRPIETPETSDQSARDRKSTRLNSSHPS